MKMHRMEDDELKACTDFIHACEAVLEREKWSAGKAAYEQWSDWDDDDDDKILMLKIRKQIAFNEEVDEEDIDGRILAYEFMEQKYTHRMTALNITASILLENCCDPTVDYLDFHPSLEMRHVAAEQ